MEKQPKKSLKELIAENKKTIIKRLLIGIGLIGGGALATMMIINAGAEIEDDPDEPKALIDATNSTVE